MNLQVGCDREKGTVQQGYPSLVNLVRFFPTIPQRDSRLAALPLPRRRFKIDFSDLSHPTKMVEMTVLTSPQMSRPRRYSGTTRCTLRTVGTHFINDYLLGVCWGVKRTSVSRIKHCGNQKSALPQAEGFVYFDFDDLLALEPVEVEGYRLTRTLFSPRRL